MDLLYSGDSINKDGYINMFEELEKHKLASLKLVSKDYAPPKYLHCKPRHPKEIWKDALNSDRVQWVIHQIVRNENKPKEEILKQSESILKDLAYTDHMTLVRTLGYALYHIYKSIYHDGVFVNLNAAKKLSEILQQHPVVFMPSHRSYMDFLMLSFVCFYLDLPLPAIAAGMDFKSMAVISTILRASGAFFMRRSFGSDRLYWALFTEYVHTILINGDRPMEFFIEGTRSRVGKSLNPKFGLLSVISEPYLKAQTYDVVIVPVSLSYDRLLEEKLYANELLGVPKPKESTSGLFKAASILQENYGSVHLHFGEPVSLRNYFGSTLDRSVHAYSPRYMLNLSSDEQMAMKRLAYHILLKQQKHMTCSPFTVVAAVLCLNPNGMCLSTLIDELIWLKPILNKCNVRVLWQTENMNDVVLQYIYRFKHLIKTTAANGQSHILNDLWITIPNSEANFQKTISLNKMDRVIQDDAANHLMLASYRNQLLCYLVRPALVAICLKKLFKQQEDKHFSKKMLLSDFTLLVHLLKKEFIFEPNNIKEDLDAGIALLVKCGVISSIDQCFFKPESHADRLLNFLQITFSSFLATYWLSTQYLLGSGTVHDQNQLYLQIQQWIVGHLHDVGVKHEMLSLNVISNAVHTLITMSALFVNKTRNQKFIEPLHSKLLQVSWQIASFIEIPYLNGVSILSAMHPSTSKL